MSQRALAEKAGISASWVSRIESGRYDPAWGDIRKLAHGLGVAMETLAEIAEGYEDTDPAPRS
jgi:transcriptional regulator with XRE-family HTH domain